MAASDTPSACDAFYGSPSCASCFYPFIVIPCVWHRRIEAGDPGQPCHNGGWRIDRKDSAGTVHREGLEQCLFDVVLLRAANLVGMRGGREIVFRCVLIFFWGVFAFVAAVTERRRGSHALHRHAAYGYPFCMGFMNIIFRWAGLLRAGDFCGGEGN